MPKDSIALIGFMATGKTVVGKALAKYLGKDYKFIETDQEIIQKVGKTISKIFTNDGEIKFREYETSICERIAKLNKVIISCGGGVVLNEKNVENLRKNCHMVLLEASIDEIYKRSLKNGIETRPIINKEDPKKEILKILNFRKPYYKAAAEIIIDTTGKRIKKIVREILIKTNLKT
ncbi:MAG: shikimate kinase [Candidatus Hodarchaeota archaeon]